MIWVGSGKRGSAPLQTGLATSLLLVFCGFAAALCWALAAPGRVVYMNSFTGLWLALACFGGGLTAGFLGRAAVWRRAGMLGMAIGAPALLLLWSISPAGPTGWEIASCLVVLPAIASIGALVGANLTVCRSVVAPASRRFRLTRAIRSRD